MERRNFVKTTGGIAFSLPWLPMVDFTDTQDMFSDGSMVLKGLIKVNDENVQKWLSAQIVDGSHHWVGGSAAKSRLKVPYAAPAI